MRIPTLAILCIGLFALASCEKSSNQESLIPEGGAVIIASSFGLCQGNCLGAYLVSSEGVRRDDGVDYYNADMGNWTFESAVVEGVDPLLRDSILTQIPTDIALFENADFGCPDCGDWGALPLAILDKDGKVVEQYLLDNATGNMNPALESYGKLMQRALAAWE